MFTSSSVASFSVVAFAALVALLMTGATGGDVQAIQGVGPILVVLVRQAGKGADPPGDPGLTKAGAERAQALAVALRYASVTAIITTQWRRTQETANPLAVANRLTPETVNLDPDPAKETEHVRAVVAAIRRHAGETVLVVGHNTTVPRIIESLGGPHLPAISDSSFGNLFSLSLIRPESVRLIHTQYGTPDSSPR